MKYIVILFALFILALEQSYAKINEDDYYVRYEKARLFSLMGENDEAIKALEKSLSGGFCQFANISHDPDLKTLRERDDFRALLKNYSTTHKKGLLFSIKPGDVTTCLLYLISFQSILISNVLL